MYHLLTVSDQPSQRTSPSTLSYAPYHYSVLSSGINLKVDFSFPPGLWSTSPHGEWSKQVNSIHHDVTSLQENPWDMTDCPTLLVKWTNPPACQANSTKRCRRKTSEPSLFPLSCPPPPPPIAGITSLNVCDSRRARNILDSCSLGSGGKDSSLLHTQPLRCPGSRAQPAAKWTWQVRGAVFLWAYLPKAHAS